MKGIKVIASDMDGTLLLHQANGEDIIGEETKNVLIEAQQAGYRLILASGRAYPKMLAFAKQLEMERYGGWLVEINGTAVYDLQHHKRKVFHQLHRQEIDTLYDKLKRQEFELIACQDEAMYYHIPKRLIPVKQAYIRAHDLPEDHPLTGGGFEIVHDNRKGYPYLYAVDDVKQLPKTMNKLCITDDPQRLSLAEEILAPYRDRFWWGYTTKRWIEILPKAANKLEGIRYCCEQMQVELKNVLAFGDGENDMEMLSHCGFGVAMGNALDSVKRIAYDVCDNNKNEGLAKVVAHLLTAS